MKVGLFDKPGAGVGPGTSPVVERESSYEARFTLLDGPTVTVNTDMSLRPGMEKAFRINEVRHYSSDPESISININGQTPPATAGYRVILKAGDRQWEMGDVSFAAGKGGGWGTGGQAKGLVADTCDVILRPSLRAIENTIEMTDYWDGALIFRNVRVGGRTGPATQQVSVPASTPSASESATHLE